MTKCIKPATKLRRKHAKHLRKADAIWARVVKKECLGTTSILAARRAKG